MTGKIIPPSAVTHLTRVIFSDPSIYKKKEGFIMKKLFRVLMVAAVGCAAAASQAQFIPDEFNTATLGPQWTFVDSTPAGTTYSLTGSDFRIAASAGSDLFTFVDNHGFIEQNAPIGTNWEVVTKIDDYNPTQAGQQRDFARGGIQLWQDNNHHFFISLLSNFDGVQMGVQTVWQTDPDNDGANNIFYEKVLEYFNTGPQPSYWFKVQKTPKGYLGFMSTDGVTWRNVMAIVRNPETPDGYFTGEKIRLFSTGGFGAGAVTPVDFDYARTSPITSPVAGYQNDEFDGSTLAPQWGYYPGMNSGAISLATGKLNMVAGPFNDLWINQEQATHIYQDAPTSNSFALTMKGAPTEFTAVPFELFNSYGIWLWHDQSNWAFISNQRGNSGNPPTPNNRIEIAAKRNGIFTAENIPFSTPANPQSPCPEYLRIEKIGNECQLQYSFDNVNWTTVTTPAGSKFQVGADNLQVRLFSKRAFGDGAPIDAQFDWLRASEVVTSNVNDWQLF